MVLPHCYSSYFPTPLVPLPLTSLQTSGIIPGAQCKWKLKDCRGLLPKGVATAHSLVCQPVTPCGRSRAEHTSLVAGTSEQGAWTPECYSWRVNPGGVAHPIPTWRGRLDLGLGLLRISSCKDVWGRVFSPFNLALKGIETLDILLFQGAGSTAWGADIEVSCKFSPFFVLVDLHNQPEVRVYPLPGLPPHKSQTPSGYQVLISYGITILS